MFTAYRLEGSLRAHAWDQEATQDIRAQEIDQLNRVSARDTIDYIVRTTQKDTKI